MVDFWLSNRIVTCSSVCRPHAAGFLPSHLSAPLVIKCTLSDISPKQDTYTVDSTTVIRKSVISIIGKRCSAVPCLVLGGGTSGYCVHRTSLPRELPLLRERERTRTRGVYVAATQPHGSAESLLLYQIKASRRKIASNSKGKRSAQAGTGNSHVQ